MTDGADGVFLAQLEAARPFLRRRAVRFAGGCPSTADDFVQDTVIKAWGARDRFERGTNLRGWTTTILQRVSMTHRASIRRRSTSPESALKEDLFVGFFDKKTTSVWDGTWDGIREHLSDELVWAIGRVPLVYREPFLLHAVAGLSVNEVAERKKCPSGTIMSRIHRARGRIREAIRGRGFARIKEQRMTKAAERWFKCPLHGVMPEDATVPLEDDRYCTGDECGSKPAELVQGEEFAPSKPEEAPAPSPIDLSGFQVMEVSKPQFVADVVRSFIAVSNAPFSSADIVPIAQAAFPGMNPKKVKSLVCMTCVRLVDTKKLVRLEKGKYATKAVAATLVEPDTKAVPVPTAPRPAVRAVTEASQPVDATCPLEAELAAATQCFRYAGLKEQDYLLNVAKCAGALPQAVWDALSDGAVRWSNDSIFEINLARKGKRMPLLVRFADFVQSGPALLRGPPPKPKKGKQPMSASWNLVHGEAGSQDRMAEPVKEDVRPFKLRMTIKQDHFEAEGPVDLVRELFSVWRLLVDQLKPSKETKQ